MINNKKGRLLSTTIPINTLSGGVGRQAPSKRLPTEAQELSNMMLTVERSIEKRPGVEVMKVQNLDGDFPNNYNFEKLGLPVDAVPNFFWHSLSDDARYLIVIDRAAVKANSDKLFYVYFFNQTTDIFENHTATDQSTIQTRIWNYLTYQPTTPLNLVAKGENLVFLNTMVQAGYTSNLHTFVAGETLGGTATTVGDTAWCTIGLDGKFKTSGTEPALDYTFDTKGVEVEYTTATKVDPDGVAVYYNTSSTYARGAEVLVLPGQYVDAHAGGHDNGIQDNDPPPNSFYYILQAVATVVQANSDLSDKNFWTVVATDDTGFVVPSGQPPLDLDRAPIELDVKNWIYPDATTPQYGQSMPTFADIRFPPPEVDVTDGNNSAAAMLAALYGLNNPHGTTPPYLNSAEGKVYYVNAGYQGNSSGYYLMKSTVAPHSMKIRSPDGHSVLDSKRMPVELEFAGLDSGKTLWEWSELEWEHRTSGTGKTNPGPTPFTDGKTAAIKTIAFFRDRLWFSSGDVVFSSRAGDYTDLWLNDPGLIIDTDPIDIAASSNKFTPITAMVPFNEYMFVNTNADTQYELMGSENQINPFTAELQPMTFYSTAPLVQPRTLGNNIFFYDRQRLYLYLGRGGSLSTAIELSQHCPNYLPKNYGAVAVAAAQDTLIAADADIPGRIVLYTTRYRGNEVLQNALYEYIITGDPVSMNVWENDIYIVSKTSDSYSIHRLSMRQPEKSVPRLDNRQAVKLFFKTTPLDTTDIIDPALAGGNFNAYYNVVTGRTTIRVPYKYSGEKLSIVAGRGFGDNKFVTATIVKDSVTEGTGYTELEIFNAIQVEQPADGSKIWIGTDYTAYAELSQQFERDANNNALEGVVNLGSMITRHFDTGNYDVIAQRRGRPTTTVLTDYETRAETQVLSTAISSFASVQADTSTQSYLTIPNLEYQGELTSKILGFSDKVKIFIISDYWTPMNITNITIRGKFKPTSSSIL